MLYSLKLGTGLPYFTGKNVTRFLQKFDKLCDKFQKPPPGRCKRIQKYCDNNQREVIREIPEWKAKE